MPGRRNEAVCPPSRRRGRKTGRAGAASHRRLAARRRPRPRTGRSVGRSVGRGRRDDALVGPQRGRVAVAGAQESPSPSATGAARRARAAAMEGPRALPHEQEEDQALSDLRRSVSELAYVLSQSPSLSLRQPQQQQRESRAPQQQQSESSNSALIDASLVGHEPRQAAEENSTRGPGTAAAADLRDGATEGGRMNGRVPASTRNGDAGLDRKRGFAPTQTIADQQQQQRQQQPSRDAHEEPRLPPGAAQLMEERDGGRAVTAVADLRGATTAFVRAPTDSPGCMPAPPPRLAGAVADVSDEPLKPRSQRGQRQQWGSFESVDERVTMANPSAAHRTAGPLLRLHSQPAPSSVPSQGTLRERSDAASLRFTVHERHQKHIRDLCTYYDGELEDVKLAARTLTDENGRLQDEVRTLHEKLAILEAECQALRTSSDRMQYELGLASEAMARRSQHDAMTHGADASVSEMHEMLKDYKERELSLQWRVDDLRKSLDEACMREEQLRQQLSDMARQQEESSAQLEALTGSHREDSARIRQLEEENRRLRGELHSATSQMRQRPDGGDQRSTGFISVAQRFPAPPSALQRQGSSSTGDSQSQRTASASAVQRAVEIVRMPSGTEPEPVPVPVRPARREGVGADVAVSRPAPGPASHSVPTSRPDRDGAAGKGRRDAASQPPRTASGHNGPLEAAEDIGKDLEQHLVALSLERQQVCTVVRGHGVAPASSDFPFLSSAAGQRVACADRGGIQPTAAHEIAGGRANAT